MSDGGGGKVDPRELLAALRWQADQLITNHFDERVWLKRAGPIVFKGYEALGPRYYITDCCFAEAPCEHHAKIAARLGN